MIARTWTARTWLARGLALALVLGAAACECDEDVCFRFPAENPDGETFIRGVIFHVDHDPEPAGGVLEQLKCVNYAGEHFPQCYGDHEGTDFLLQGGFEKMDAGSANVVAAADGVVITVVDGNYDRCHASLAALLDGGIDCDGHPMRSNHVKIRHVDGTVTEYHHMMTNSIVVAVGDEVRCGDVLGKVGSSGKSATPHVHFEVHGPDGTLRDPFAGPETQPSSQWVEQGPGLGLPGEVCQGSSTR